MSRQRATILILLGATAMSFAALFVRLVDQADGYQILAYRSLTLSAMVGTVLCLNRRTGLGALLSSLDKSDLKMGLSLSLAFTFYVFALLHTSVASALFILSAAPFIAAILGWVWIGERPAPIVWVTIFTAATGITIMISEGMELGRTSGNVFALLSATFFAVTLVIARGSKKDDVLGGTFLGGVFSCLLAFGCALTIGSGVAISTYDLGITLFMGAFTIGLGIALVTWGTPYVPAAEVSLLVLLESVLSPVWVWLFLGEDLTARELTGGALVLASVGIMVVKRPAKAGRQA